MEKSVAPGRKAIGAVSGAAIGGLTAIVFGAVGGSCGGSGICLRGEVMLRGLVVLVPLGAAIGAVAAHNERWEAVPGPRV